jgi:hypothetical protein
MGALLRWADTNVAAFGSSRNVFRQRTEFAEDPMIPVRAVVTRHRDYKLCRERSKLMAGHEAQSFVSRARGPLPAMRFKYAKAAGENVSPQFSLVAPLKPPASFAM